MERLGGEPPPPTPDERARAKAKSRAWWIMHEKQKGLLARQASTPPSPEHWHAQCHRLIYEGRLDEALEKWLGATKCSADAGEVRRSAKALMRAFNRSERALGTPQVFAALVEFDRRLVDTRCLNLLLESYLRNGRPEKLVEAFKSYKGAVEPDHATVNILLRNFIATKRLDEAESLLRILLESGGPVTNSSFAILLAGVKQASGDLGEMRRIVEWMKTTDLGLHTSIYNIMIQMALENGRYGLARAYAEEMVARGLSYNTDTFVLFLSRQSRAGDWVGVRRTMERMHEYNLKISTEGFNTLLSAHASGAADLSYTEHFFDSMAAHGVVPDRFSFNIMIHACTRARNDAAKARWVARMKAAGHPPDAVTSNILFHGLRKLPNSHPSILRRVYAAIAAINPNLVNTRTKQMLLDSMYKDSILPYLPRRTPLTPPDPFAPETHAMELALDSSRPLNAICIFSDVLSRGVKPSPPLVAAAIRAAFRLPDTEHDEVSRLLAIAHLRGINVTEVAMSVIANDPGDRALHYATSSHRLAATLERLKAAYEFVGQAYLPVSHYVLVQAAWSLITDGDATGAVELMHRVASSRWGGEVKWDVVGLTVLLRAYTAMGDVGGVAWVVEQVERGEVVPDKRFLMYLRRAKEVAESKEDEGVVGWLVVRCLKLRERLKGVEADGRAREVLGLLRDGGLEGVEGGS